MKKEHRPWLNRIHSKNGRVVQPLTMSFIFSFNKCANSCGICYEFWRDNFCSGIRPHYPPLQDLFSITSSSWNTSLQSRGCWYLLIKSLGMGWSVESSNSPSHLDKDPQFCPTKLHYSPRSTYYSSELPCSLTPSLDANYTETRTLSISFLTSAQTYNRHSKGDGLLAANKDSTN